MSERMLAQHKPLLIDAASLRAYLSRERQPQEFSGAVARGAVYGLVMLLTCADVKTITTLYVHWWALVPFLALLFPTMLRARWHLNWSILFGGLVFTASVMISGWQDPKYAAEQALKLASICLGSFLFFQQFPSLGRSGFTAIRHAVYLNTACLLSMFFIPGFAAWQMAPGRWGTVLHTPGSLWRVGILTLIYAGYLVYVERPFSFRGLLLFSCSCAVIYADGSRTAMFLIPLSVVYLGLVLLRETRSARDTLQLAFLVVAGIFAAGFFLDARSQMFGTYADNADALTRIGQFSDRLSSEGLYGLVDSDPVRYEMVRSTVEKIKEDPFFGNGIGTTRVSTSAGPMVVHMTYLQLWADLGIFGLLAYLWVTCSWTPGLRRAFLAIRNYRSAKERALYYNAVFILVFFVFSGFFHPISTEWPEWIAFAIALGFFNEIAVPKKEKRRFLVVKAAN